MSLASTQTHQLALLETMPAGELLIHEIYCSFQGESTADSHQADDARLTGCRRRQSSRSSWSCSRGCSNIHPMRQ
jgi:hypothetical protein